MKNRFELVALRANRLQRFLRTFVGVVLVFFPACAFANAGTPLMWAGALHLLIGNAVIGLCEGWLVARLFGVDQRLTLLPMVAANYCSSWVGVVGIEKLKTLLDGRFGDFVTIYTAPKFLLVLVIVSLLVSVILEWPFLFLAFWKSRNRFRTSLGASAIAQIASYAALVPFYLLVSDQSLYTRTHLVEPADVADGNKSWVYFLGAHDGHVWRARVDGTQLEKVFDDHVTNPDGRLFVRRSESGVGYDLWVKRTEKNEARLISNFANRAALSGEDKRGDEERGTWFSFGRAADLRSEKEREWEVRTGFWAVEGLVAENAKSGVRLRVALETPFLNWFCRNATVLPGDKVVFQVRNQIVILDLKTRKLALIAPGRGPVVALAD